MKLQNPVGELPRGNPSEYDEAMDPPSFAIMIFRLGVGAAALGSARHANAGEAQSLAKD
jgi:hypothetical protein